MAGLAVMRLAAEAGDAKLVSARLSVSTQTQTHTHTHMETYMHACEAGDAKLVSARLHKRTAIDACTLHRRARPDKRSLIIAHM